MERQSNGRTLFLCAVLCAQVSHALIVTELPQGLLQQKTDMKLTSTLWTVIITVEDTTTSWEHVMQAVTKLMDLNYSRMDPWSRAQFVRLRNRISHLAQTHRPRKRRGFIDGIGYLAHELFGLATDREIHELKQRIEENRRWQQKMSVWQKDFLVIINRTREDMAQNRALLNNLTQTTIRFMDETRLIISLQDHVHQLEVIHQRRQRIIDDLEHGMLTELLLPRATLTSIVKDAGLPVEWYYRWCTVRPLWHQGWVFETQLPIVADAPIIGYKIIPFPVWGPGNQTVKLDIARYAALDTQTGHVSEPRSCKGQDPLVCSNGAISQHGCAAAVIAQQEVAATCHVVPVEKKKRFFSLMENEIVAVFERPALVSQTCPNDELPQRATLARGTHRLQWRPGCRLETPFFSINAAHMPVGRRQVRGWHIPQGALDLIEYFQNVTFPSVLPPLIPLNLELLPTPPFIQWHHRPPVIAITLFIIIAILACLIIWNFCGTRSALREYCLKWYPCWDVARSDHREQHGGTNEPPAPRPPTPSDSITHVEADAVQDSTSYVFS